MLAQCIIAEEPVVDVLSFLLSLYSAWYYITKKSNCCPCLHCIDEQQKPFAGEND